MGIFRNKNLKHANNIHNSVKRRRTKLRRNIFVFGIVAALVALAGLNFVTNRKSLAAGNAPNWGNDGLGIVFKDKIITDESGQQLKQHALASYGETVNYSVKLDGKERVNGNIAVAYGITIKFDAAMTPIGDMPIVKVGNTVLSPDQYYFEYNQDPQFPDEGELFIGIRWADYEALGECVSEPPMGNISDDFAYWLANQSTQPSCPSGYHFVPNWLYGNPVSIYGDDQVDISISAIFDNPDGKHVTSGITAASHAQIYLDNTGNLQYEEELQPTQAEVHLGSLLIRKTDELGNPIEGVKFAVDGLKFTNYSGAYFPTNEGMEELTTNAFGEVLISGLPIGDYTVRETAAPEGLIVDETPVIRHIGFTGMKRTEYNRFVAKLTTDYGEETTQAFEQMLNTADLIRLPNGDLVLPDAIHNLYPDSYYPEDYNTYTWNEASQRYTNRYTGWTIEYNENGGYDAEISGNIIHFSEHESDSELSYLERDDEYIVDTGTTNYGQVILSWDEEMGAFFGVVRQSSRPYGEPSAKLVELPNGDIQFTANPTGHPTTVTPTRTSDNGWSCVIDGVSFTIKKTDIGYVVKQEVPDSSFVQVFKLIWSEEAVAYIADPVVAGFTLTENDDNSVEMEQGIYFENIGDNQYSGILAIFPITFEYKPVLTPIVAAEATVINYLNPPAPSDDPVTPEDIVNPPTFDEATIALAIFSAVAIVGFAGRRRLNRH